VSQTSRISATVEVANPSSSQGSITFSSPNRLVTAYVPGGQAVYADNAWATGTIVGQPAVGGSGEITWDPGTVAAGAVATPSYEVVVTPALPGQRIVVTVAPASQGTTAQYLNAAGNSGQTQAIYTFGPLCELTVSSAARIAITLASFTAYPEHALPISLALSPHLASIILLGMVAVSTGALRVWRCVGNGEDSALKTRRKRNSGEILTKS